MQIYASFNKNRLTFHPDEKSASKFKNFLPVVVDEATLSGWLGSSGIDEYVDEYEELPWVEVDATETESGPIDNPWNKQFEANVRAAANRIEEKGLMSTVVCNYLNLEVFEIDPFWISTFELFVPKKSSAGIDNSVSVN